MRILSSLFIIAWCATITATAQVIPINQFKQRSLSDTIKAGEIVAGRVTVANQFSNTCFIQDGTGGIAIFNNNFRSGVAIGDSVHITGGTYQEFQATTGQPGTGLGQIAGSKFVFTVIPVARVPQAARTVAITSVGEASEATLIRLRNVKFTQTGLFQGDVNYFVKNAQGDSIQVRIDRATDIAVAQAQIPTDNVDMTAVVSQFRGTYQIQPRFGADLGLVIERDTVSKSRTMDITTWNLLWFGKVDVPGDSAGPTDKARQFTSIRRAMDSVGADIYALQEVVSEDALNRLRDSLAIGYNTLIASEINQTQKMAYLFNKQTVEKVESGLAVNGGAQA
ncbi:MAG: hypothetical protein JNL32_11855, partial [Candidatus Kapabacteria bacterium]|nr:hypothetical protein [Candidatus Kapabacteria bacterium]